MAENTVCIHIGARAHYLFPKALQKEDQLYMVITDTWVSSAPVRKMLLTSSNFTLKSLAGRFTPDIPVSKVKSFGLAFLVFEILLRFRYKDAWDQILARNRYFETKSLHILKQLAGYDSVLGISYTAGQCFAFARQNGKKTVLFQIDPAIEEETIVTRIVEEYQTKYPTLWKKAPAIYWTQWKEECRLSDIIIVNSLWSKHAIVKHGIETEKIKVIPLPVEIKPEQELFTRQYPDSFSQQRPLVCLFLGTLSLRKGIHIVLEAARRMADAPISFLLVGSSELAIDFAAYPNVQYKGVVSRSETDAYYRASDVFLFPTLSDGFGLTQLEAMSWKLPVIASLFCGDVVKDKENGFLLQENTTEELISVLHLCLAQPYLLQALSNGCFETAKENNIQHFSRQLMQCFDDRPSL